MSAQRIARCGLCCALLAVSAWVSIPLGPVPFTLQTLVLAMLPGVLAPREAVLTVATYLVLGVVGLPVFSNMMGGLGVILGPTGGFLWGFLLGSALGALALELKALPELARHALCALVMLVTSYVLGTVHLASYLSVSLPAAALSAVVPFVLPDLIKLGVGVTVGLRVRRALGASGMVEGA